MERTFRVRITERALQSQWMSGIGETIMVQRVPDGDADYPMVVVYPGWHNRAAGPDFRDAVFHSADGIIRGDVELHREPRDWDRHGHATDTRYSNVVLHVVWDGGTERHHGRSAEGRLVFRLGFGNVPVIVPVSTMSSRPVGDQKPHPTPFKCRNDQPEVRALLISLGHARYRANANRLASRLWGVQEWRMRSSDTLHLSRERQLDQHAVDQVLFEEVAACLGYRGNESAMRRLTSTLTLEHLHGTKREHGLLAVQDALAETSGLFRPRVAEGTASLSPFQIGSADTISWDLANHRPRNDPRERIRQLGFIVDGWPPEGLMRRILKVVQDDPRPVASIRGLRRCFDSLAQGSAQAGLRSRGADMVLNVFLPAIRAHGSLSGDPTLVTVADHVFATHPPLAPNSITRRVSDRITLSRVSTAATQQGLLALWEGPCQPLDCTHCPISRG